MSNLLHRAFMDNEIVVAHEIFRTHFAKLRSNGDKWNSTGDKDEESRLTAARFETGWHV